MDLGPTSTTFSLLRALEGQDSGQVAKKVLSHITQSSVGTLMPVTGANLIKEIDSMANPTYYKPGKDQVASWFLSQQAFFRVSGRPLVNALGEEVEIARTPWDRWYGGTANPDQLLKEHNHPAGRREWVAIAKWARNGVFLPGQSLGGRDIVGSDLKKRPMTQEEIYEYNKQSGQKLKELLVMNLDWLEKTTPETAQRWLDKTSRRIRDGVAKRIAYEARQAQR